MGEGVHVLGRPRERGQVVGSRSRGRKRQGLPRALETTSEGLFHSGGGGGGPGRTLKSGGGH